MNLFYYDLETYPNCFLFTGKFEGTFDFQTFEISSRRNDRDALLSWISYLQNAQVQMVGYNSLGFDYPILHELLMNPYTFDALKANHLGNSIIAQTYGLNQYMLSMKERIIPQIDLVKINHFDNANKRTSLKSLQFAMRSQSVEDLPFEVRDLTFEEMDQLRDYNLHDVTETEAFGSKCKHLIQMRQELIDQGILGGDVLNYSDVKIGTEYLIKKIGRAKCFVSGSTPRQSIRKEVRFENIILPKIFFRTEEYNGVLNWFSSQVIYPTAEGERPKLEASLSGLQFFFGVGGVHASVEDHRYESTKDFVIKDIDVSGMYVAVAIANGFFPEHLGQEFVAAYKQLQSDRKQYPKGSSMNAVLKLAGNGVYGNSNNSYSCFYDPKYTFSVTVNGQLQLLQLVESLSLIPGLQLIQANTDGITALVPRSLEYLFKLWKTDWETKTGLTLEEVEYSKMFIRDVNNYVAVTTDGKVKRKGAYWYPETEKEYEGWWNKDFSNMSAQKGINAILLYGGSPADIVRLINDPFDFMLRYKTPAGAKVYIGDKEMLKTVRYYVSTQGQPMKKIAVPKGAIGAFKRKNKLTDSFYNKTLASIPVGTWDERIHTKNKSTYQAVTTSIESGRLVKECNRAKVFNWSDVDYSYYIEEIDKLIVGRNNERAV